MYVQRLTSWVRGRRMGRLLLLVPCLTCGDKQALPGFVIVNEVLAGPWLH